MAMTIAKTAAETERNLREMAPRARERTLEAGGIEYAIRTHLRYARRVAKVDPERITMTVLRGGYVPNSYKYRASCDEVWILGTSAKDLVVSYARAAAQRRPRGAGSTLIVRSRTKDESLGRIEHSE